MVASLRLSGGSFFRGWCFSNDFPVQLFQWAGKFKLKLSKLRHEKSSGVGLYSSDGLINPPPGDLDEVV